MRAAWWLGFVATTACGGKAVIDAGPSGAGGSAATVTSTTTSTSAVTSVATSTGAGGSMPFRIDVWSAVASANCQPAVPPDPMDATVVLRVDNTDNPLALQVDVTGVTVVSPIGTTTFDVLSVGPTLVTAGVEADLAFVKQPGSAFGAPGCAFCNDTELEVEVEVTAGGEAFVVVGALDSFSCVF